MYGALVLALVGAVVALTFLMAGDPPAAAGDQADPHAADVAAFRAELAEWDRRGRP